MESLKTRGRHRREGVLDKEKRGVLLPTRFYRVNPLQLPTDSTPEGLQTRRRLSVL